MSLQEQIKQLRERTTSNDLKRKRATANTRIAQMQKDAGLFYRFYLQVAVAAVWVFRWIIWPAYKVFSWPFKKLFKLYKKLWSLLVYKRDEFGDLKFSKIRAGLMLLFSIPTILATFNLAIDGTIYSATYKNKETVYLFAASDNSFKDDDEFSVTGCEVTETNVSDFSCDSEGTLYFRVSGGLIEHIYSIATQGHIFYPDAVANALAPGWNLCQIDSWYFRIKILYRNTNIYPKLLYTSCKPVFNSR